jgi:hypothetical protein
MDGRMNLMESKRGCFVVRGERGGGGGGRAIFNLCEFGLSHPLSLSLSLPLSLSLSHYEMLAKFDEIFATALCLDKVMNKSGPYCQKSVSDV